MSEKGFIVIGVIDRFERRSSKTPDAVAVRFGVAQLTYGQLDRGANRLAHHLRDLGVNTETMVGVHMRHSFDSVISSLAILKAGGCYVPLDPGLPSGRLADMVSVASLQLVLSTSPSGPSEVVSTLRVDAETTRRAVDARATTAPWRGGYRPDQLAYVVFTSGTTGRPKGIALTAATLDNAVGQQVADDGGHVRDCVALASIGFDVSLLEVFVTLVEGGCIHLVDEATRRDPEALLDMIIDGGVGRIYLVPQMLQQLATAWAARPRHLPLKEVLVSGDRLRLSSEVTQFMAQLDDAVLDNQYGPSETHHATMFRLSGDVGGWPVSPPIGQPIPGVEVLLLDHALQPVREGAVGEVYVAGRGLARGYLAQPGLTAQRFVADPRNGHGGRLYRTGDLARHDDRHELEFVGRADTQVKIRGYRVEPAEVEAVLSAHPDVVEVAVVARLRDEDHGATELIAYLVPATASEELDLRRIRADLATQLPAYLIPAAFVPMASLPVNHNGKVDRSALPPPDTTRVPGTSVGWRHQWDRAICGIWEDALGIAPIGIDDEFFELGGNSLLATNVAARIRRMFDVELPSGALFEQASVRSLADRVRNARHAPAARIKPRPATSEEIADLSFAQRRLWFLDQLTPHSSTYVVQACYRLDGIVSVDALEASLSELRSRHEVLRTHYLAVDGEPRIVVDQTAANVLRVLDFSTFDPGIADVRSSQLVREDGARPFDLANDWPMRVALVRLSARQSLLILTFHHLVIDGWSMHVFWQELSTTYDAFCAGEIVSLAPLPIQYSDYARWQKSWLTPERVAGPVAFWREMLAGAAPALELPTDRPRPATLSGAGAQVEFTVAPQVTALLRKLGQASGATMYVVLLAAFDVLLSRYTGSKDIVTGSPMGGRTVPELAGLIGFFVNAVPIRLRWSGDLTFTKLLHLARDVALSAYAQEEVPFDRLVEEMAVERDASRNPIFQVWLDVDSVRTFATPVGLDVRAERTESTNTRFDLEMIFEDTGHFLTGSLGYSTDLFDEATIRRMARNLVAVLTNIANDPQRKISRLLDFSDETLTAAPRPLAQASLSCDPITAWETRAAELGDQDALIHEGRRMSYRELESRSNQLAHYLRGRGIVAGDVVAVCLAPGMDALVCLLGVMKCAAVYLPLDFRYPPDRLAFTLTDSQAALVLADTHCTNLRASQHSDVVVWEEIESSLADQPATTQRRNRSLTELAYMVYTSGSTGRPKGIAVAFRTIVTFVGWKLATEPRPRRCAQLASLGFDVSLQEFFVTMLGGGTLIIVDEDTRQDPAALLELLASESVQRLYLSPGLLHQIALTYHELARPPLALIELIVGGEALTLSDETIRFLADLDGVSLENQYGPSETHEVTACVLTGAPNSWPTAPPIGRPIADVAAYLLDENLRPVPANARGEVYVGGRGVAQGYVRQPGLTAERFIADPFAGPGERMYRSGDVASRREDGALIFHGRSDGQIKIRGHRVEPTEVEAAIGAYPHVQAVAALPYDEPDGRHLAAYVVIQPGVLAPSAAELRAYARDRLPAYMIPTRFLNVDAIPLNRNGKVDQSALPSPFMSEPVSDRQYVGPRNDQEQVVAEIIVKVLRMDRVGIDDDFFQIGGHSLLAVRVVAWIRKEFDVSLPVRVVFEGPTVRQLAAVVEERILAQISALTVEQVEADVAGYSGGPRG